MKLRTKLLLGVGLLLFLMVLIMYILPSILIKKDVYKAADEIHDLLVKDQQQLIRSQQIWLEDALVMTKENNDALLFMLYQEPQLSSRLEFTNKNSYKEVWNTLANVASYDPSIGFVQVHNPQKNQTAVITPHAADLILIDKVTKHENYILLSLETEGEQKNNVYIGIALPTSMQKDPTYTIYALIDPKKSQEQFALINEEISHLTPGLIKKELYESNQLELRSTNHKQPAIFWAIKLDLIRALTPLYVEGLTFFQSGNSIVPEGLARLDSTGNGFAVLSKEIYLESPLFNDELYYKQNQPKKLLAPPLANGTVIVTDRKKDSAYIGNTLMLGEENYFSIGTPVGFLARQLALSSNKFILLKVSQNFWMGFDGDGKKLSQDMIKKFVKEGDFQQKSGETTIDQATFFFSQVSSLEKGDLVFYDFHPFAEGRSIVSTLLSLEDNLSQRISLQLSLIAIGTMILVLLFIGRIGFTVIYPVTRLAKATQDVVSGRYEEVVMPDVGDRQDEVAILTRSFDDMVKGLREREKIRGVLDKVVSKDVADEILRTQIHLGGEDRVVSILFSDIRSFTSLTANLEPQKTIHILNVCMTKVSRVIEGEGGVIDKYVGDEVMAIFGAPTSHPDHALRAVSSGMLIIETLKKWNQTRIAEGKSPIEMGIGVHTGLVVAGNMGAEDRLNYTVLGSNVNLAARITELAKPNQLIISEATLAEPNVKESFYAKQLAKITPKGFTEPIQLYEITGFKWEES